ncbi:uncharacterized protein [Nothobranchius furzeri]|uniref:uncharacterized protein n=1 Tax=Nothobranchius furzeri TaxID=105023 RepID=UPI003904666B
MLVFWEEHGIFIVERPVTAGVPEDVIRILNEDEGRYPALHIPDDDVVFVDLSQAPPQVVEFVIEGLSSDEELEVEFAFFEGLSRDEELEVEFVFEGLRRDEELEAEFVFEGLRRDEESEETDISSDRSDLGFGYPALHIPDDDVVFVGHGQAPPVEAEFAFEGLSSDEELEETDSSSDWSAFEDFMASSVDSGYGSSVLDSDEDQQLPPPEDFWLPVAPPAPPEELPEDPRPAHGSAEEDQDVEEPTPSTSVIGSIQKRTGERFLYIPPKRPRWDDSDSD